MRDFIFGSVLGVVLTSLILWTERYVRWVVQLPDISDRIEKIGLLLVLWMLSGILISASFIFRPDKKVG